jgi:hypothetical protein
VGFDAGNAVEPLDYDFTKYVSGAKGTIPEPSDLALTRFARHFKQLMTAIVQEGTKVVAAESDAQPSELTLEEALTAMSDPDLGDDKVAMVTTKMSEIVAELSQGQPSVEQMVQLPERIRGAFFAWLMRELFAPEGVAVDTKPSLRVVAGG